jgi:hypothetical protein
LIVIHVDDTKVPDATLPFPFSGDASRGSPRLAFFYSPPTQADVLPVTRSSPSQQNTTMLIARPHPWLVLVLSVLLTSIPILSAETRTPPAQAANSPNAAPASPCITAYSSIDFVQASPDALPVPGQSRAIVYENRMLNFTSGENQLDLAGFPTGLEPTSLSIRPSASRDITLLEHTYIAPTTTPDDILRNYLSRDIIINRRQPGTGDAALRPETITGKLLAFDRNSLLIETNNRQLPLEMIPRSPEITEIKFIGPTTRSTSQPVVACRFLSDASGPADVQLSYQTTGIQWQCTYNLIIRDKDLSADLEPWIRICNSSGVSFPRANLRLGITPLPGEDMPADLANQQYTISRPIALPDNSTQQIALAPPRRNLHFSRVYVYRPQAIAAGTPQQPAANHAELDSCLLLNNNAKDGLGIPLPPGRVELYRESASNEPPLLLGQRTIPATPVDRPLLIKLATAHDVLGQRQAIVSKEPRPGGAVQVTENVEITIHNQHSQPIHVILLEPLPHAGAHGGSAGARVRGQDQGSEGQRG